MEAGEMAGQRNRASQTLREQDLDQIRDSLRGLRYGVVNIVVQDGVIVQIDRTEKRRIRRAAASPEVRPNR